MLMTMVLMLAAVVVDANDGVPFVCDGDIDSEDE